MLQIGTFLLTIRYSVTPATLFSRKSVDASFPSLCSAWRSLPFLVSTARISTSKRFLVVFRRSGHFPHTVGIFSCAYVYKGKVIFPAGTVFPPLAQIGSSSSPPRFLSKFALARRSSLFRRGQFPPSLDVGCERVPSLQFDNALPCLTRERRTPIFSFLSSDNVPGGRFVS